MYTPETVKTCVRSTVDSLVSVLDALDKVAEITSAGVRRFLRDDLGVTQATAQCVRSYELRQLVSLMVFVNIHHRGESIQGIMRSIFIIFFQHFL